MDTYKTKLEQTFIKDMQMAKKPHEKVLNEQH